MSISMTTSGPGGSSTVTNQPGASSPGISVTLSSSDGASIVQSIQSLTPRPEPVRLGPAGTPVPIRAQTGLAPLHTAKIRTEEVTVQSTDGLFSFVVRVVKP